MEVEPGTEDVREQVVVPVCAVEKDDREMREEIVVAYHLQESPSKHKIVNRKTEERRSVDKVEVEEISSRLWRNTGTPLYCCWRKWSARSLIFF